MDDIEKLFTDISVDDFLRPTSAVHVETFGPDERALSSGLDHFNVFTDALIEMCVKALTAEEFTAFSVLHNSDEQRYFKPDDDETAYHFAARLKREATEMHAHWAFCAMLTPGRTYTEGEDGLVPVDPDDREQVEHLLETGELNLGVCWFADDIEGQERHQRSGMIVLGDEGIQDKVEGAVDPEFNPFHNILER